MRLSDRVPRLLIPDSTPLSLLSMIGREALDWLFAPGVEVWVTDMVRHEALRDPDPGDDQSEQRQTLRQWFADNAGRIRIQQTPEGQDYERQMRNWIRGGSRPTSHPGETAASEVSATCCRSSVRSSRRARASSC